MECVILKSHHLFHFVVRHFECDLLALSIKCLIKCFPSNRGQAEREFKVEVEAIGRVRHKNLVRLLGYCAEGAHRYSTFTFFASLYWSYVSADYGY